jgi:hypothetical protein
LHEDFFWLKTEMHGLQARSIEITFAFGLIGPNIFGVSGPNKARIGMSVVEAK